MNLEYLILADDDETLETAAPSELEGEPGELQSDQTEIEILKDIKLTNTVLVMLLTLLIFFVWLRGFFRQ